MVPGIDEQPPAPVSAAGYGLNLPTINFDKGVSISVLFPGVGGVDGVHNIFFEHPWQRTLPNSQQRQRSTVYPNIVIFVIGSRLL